MTALEQALHLASVPLDIEVELARRALTVRQILELGPGSLIKLPRAAGENIDILVGGARLGSGEIVVIEDTVGVRITCSDAEDWA